jgi:hypothetical protein
MTPGSLAQLAGAVFEREDESLRWVFLCLIRHCRFVLQVDVRYAITPDEGPRRSPSDLGWEAAPCRVDSCTAGRPGVMQGRILAVCRDVSCDEMIGREQALAPDVTKFERLYVRLLGYPALGLRVRAKSILPLLPRLPAPRAILDAGCGKGVFTIAAARAFPSATVVGTDLSPRWWRAIETLANDISYLITGGRERRKALYAACFPWLRTLLPPGVISSRHLAAVRVRASSRLHWSAITVWEWMSALERDGFSVCQKQWQPSSLPTPRRSDGSGVIPPWA